MRHVWRIAATRGEYVADDMSGAGSAKLGGRFNSKGMSVVYASTTVSLCVLETLAHFGADAVKEDNRYIVRIEVPDEIYEQAKVYSVALIEAECVYWKATPAATVAAKLGDTWLRSMESALLILPSVIVPHEDVPDRNVLINPAHPDAAKIKAQAVSQFRYDIRL